MMFFALPQTSGSGTLGTTKTQGHLTRSKSETPYRFKKWPNFPTAWRPPYASTAVQQFNCRFRHGFPGFLSVRKSSGNRFSWADEKVLTNPSAWAADGWPHCPANRSESNSRNQGWIARPRKPKESAT